MINPEKAKFIWIGLAVLCLILAVCYTLWVTFTFAVTRYTVTFSRLPAAFRGFKIAQVSDLHGDEFGKKNSKLLAALQAEKPDIIVLTGDFFDPGKIPVALDFTAKAAAIAPCYFITGNHESRLGSDYAEAEQILMAQGVTVLRNKTVAIQKGTQAVWLAGVDDPAADGAERVEQSDYFNTVLTDIVPESGFCILLSHRPEKMAAYVQAGVDLVFCGHAHGGQIRLPFAGGVYAPGQGLFPRYDSGLFCESQTTMVLSRGLGSVFHLPRFNNRPELVVVTLN